MHVNGLLTSSVLRLGKPIEHLRNALTVDPTAPLFESLTSIARQLGKVFLSVPSKSIISLLWLSLVRHVRLGKPLF